MIYGYVTFPRTGHTLNIVSDNNVTFFLQDAEGQDQDEWVPHSEHWSIYPRNLGGEVRELTQEEYDALRE